MTVADEMREIRRFRVSRDGDVFGPSGKKLTPFPVKGYLRVNGFSAGKRRAEPVHRLVCEAFHGPAPESAELVRHLDGDPLNNRADNLAWGTFHDNEQDKSEHGRDLRGERHHQAKLTQAQVDVIRNAPAETTHTEIAGNFGVSRHAIARIRNGKGWRCGA